MDYEDKAVYGGIYSPGSLEAEGAVIKDVILTTDKDEKLELEVWVELGSKLLNPLNKHGGWEAIPVHETSTRLPVSVLMEEGEELSQREEIVLRQLQQLLELPSAIERAPDTLLKFAPGGEYVEALRKKKVFIITKEVNGRFYVNLYFFRAKAAALSIESIKERIRAKAAGL